MVKFNNTPNTLHTIEGRMVPESRSVAVVGVIVAIDKHTSLSYLGCKDIYVLAEKRSRNMDSPGKWCLPCGYLDWDETGPEALIREVYEECYQ